VTTRAQIRSAINALITNSALVSNIVISRNADVTDLDKYIRIYFGEGEDLQESNQPFVDAEIFVSYGSTSEDDDRLDSIMNQVYSAFAANHGDLLSAELVTVGADPISAIQRTGFNYEPTDGNQHNVLTYRFVIRYFE